MTTPAVHPLAVRRIELGYATPAEAARQAGLTEATWSRYEVGRGCAHLATARRVARVLVVPVAAVLREQSR